MVVDTRNIIRYGDLAKVLEALKENGWTGVSVRYVVDQIFWEDTDGDTPAILNKIVNLRAMLHAQYNAEDKHGD